MAQTIRQAIEPKLAAGAQARLDKLTKLNAPHATLATQQTAIDNGDLAAKVGHIKDYGDLEFTATENRKFRRGYGVRFSTTDGRQIDMIPGPYGLFLTEVED